MTTSRYVKIGGTTSEPAYHLDVSGDVNITGLWVFVLERIERECRDMP